MAEIKRLPDGCFVLRVDPEELEIVRLKINHRETLTDREETIAREFEL